MVDYITFKLVQIFSQLQEHFSAIFIIYNFFITYHGHNVCDVAVAHGKRKVRSMQQMNNVQSIIQTF